LVWRRKLDLLRLETSGRYEIWRVPAHGGVAGQITRNGGFAAFESPDGKTLYYTISGAGDEGLFAKRLPDGDEEQVVKENVAWRGFAVFSEGVYYLHRRVQNSYEIRFYEFASGQVRVIAEIEAPLSVWSYGLAVSPDRKTFLFSKNVSQASDLMMIENFR